MHVCMCACVSRHYEKQVETGSSMDVGIDQPAQWRKPQGESVIGWFINSEHSAGCNVCIALVFLAVSMPNGGMSCRVLLTAHKQQLWRLLIVGGYC